MRTPEQKVGIAVGTPTLFLSIGLALKAATIGDAFLGVGGVLSGAVLFFLLGILFLEDWS
jgi:hypothetical protein